MRNQRGNGLGPRDQPEFFSDPHEVAISERRIAAAAVMNDLRRLGRYAEEFGEKNERRQRGIEPQLLGAASALRRIL